RGDLPGDGKPASRRHQRRDGRSRASHHRRRAERLAARGSGCARQLVQHVLFAKHRASLRAEHRGCAHQLRAFVYHRHTSGRGLGSVWRLAPDRCDGHWRIFSFEEYLIWDPVSCFPAGASIRAYRLPDSATASPAMIWISLYRQRKPQTPPAAQDQTLPISPIRRNRCRSMASTTSRFPAAFRTGKISIRTTTRCCPRSAPPSRLFRTSFPRAATASSIKWPTISWVAAGWKAPATWCGAFWWMAHRRRARCPTTVFWLRWAIPPAPRRFPASASLKIRCLLWWPSIIPLVPMAALSSPASALALASLAGTTQRISRLRTFGSSGSIHATETVSAFRAAVFARAMLPRVAVRAVHWRRWPANRQHRFGEQLHLHRHIAKFRGAQRGANLASGIRVFHGRFVHDGD